MLLGGLWHGAKWTFVVWGALHGLYLWIEKGYRDMKKMKSSQVFVPETSRTAEGYFPPEINHPRNLRNFLNVLATFFLVNVTWVFFRATDFTSAWRILHSMFINNPKNAPILTTLEIYKVSIIIPLLVIAHWMMRNTTALTVAGKTPWWLLGLVWSAMIVLIMLSQNASSAFIYFQF